MMRYSFSITHVPGKQLVIADTLSQAPLSEPTSADNSLQEETAAFVNLILNHLPATEEHLEEITRLQTEDEECRAIANFCRSGWPDRKILSPKLKRFSPMEGEFLVEKGLLLRGGRIFVPPPLRANLLCRVHEGHQGITKCRERARSSIWWPGLPTDLEELVRNCEECAKAQAQRAQPLTPYPLPDLPWQRVATDLFLRKEATYLLMVDYLSRCIEIAPLERPTAQEVIMHLKTMFACHGIPEVVVSDNGPQYLCETFKEFACDFQFQHDTSSPYYPQGNGEAERVIKSLQKKNGDPYKALLAYRTTPTATGYSPCELLMGRLLRNTVPTTRDQLQPQLIDPASVRRRDEHNKERQRKNFDNHRGARELPQLQPGDSVWLPDKKVAGKAGEVVAPQSFNVLSEDGSYRRNRRDIIRLPDPPAPAENMSQNTRSPDESPEPLRRSTRDSRPPNRFDPS